jgi:hypothetical protein
VGKKTKCCGGYLKKGKRCGSCPLGDEEKVKDTKKDKKKKKKKEKKKKKKEKKKD